MPENIFSKVDFDFAAWNQKAVFTTSLLIFTGLAIIIYLGSLYFTIQAGFILREQGDSLDKMEKEVRLQEIQVSNFETTLASNPGYLSDMEKISFIRYIRTSSEVSYK